MDFEEQKEIISQLLQSNVIGFHDQIEVVTVFGFDRKKQIKFNVLSALVAQESKDDDFEIESYINDKRITLNESKFKHLSFGISRSKVTIHDALFLLEEVKSRNQLTLDSLNPISLSNKIQIQPKIFVPADSTKEVPFNLILKNNFFNGSYVFEWVDTEKENLDIFFEFPSLLQEISEKIQQYIPLKIASLSDKLGNIILQIPVTLIVNNIVHSKDGNYLKLKTTWHPKADYRNKNLTFTCIRLDDGACSDYHCCELNFVEDTIIPMSHQRGIHRGYLWDNDLKILLYSTAESSFMHEIKSTITMIENEPRVFYLKDNKGKKLSQPINIDINNNHEFTVDDPQNDSYKAHRNWTEKRLFEHEKRDLLDQKKLIQYKADQQENALRDIRYLISKYGSKGVNLWDPYLDPQALLKTLFYCPHYNVPLKAITALELSPSNKEIFKQNDKKKIIQEYATELEDSCENKFGLELEFRTKINRNGWSFHDRFIIFPETEQGPRAWSLGTSVNSLGNSHHIFQEVSDGRIIADAFEELWSAIQHEECLIWKS
ncbi:VPA1262 family N-terminal domain-containing protein [Acinetobacter guillouiae]|uniref:VPA1262 family N-terminal domain-containing protein n=1 Tax=Acinetobacter guillouiae TaxID=106649 RepID=UPI0032B474E0